MHTPSTTSLRYMLTTDKLLFRPCAYDALSAILIEKTGFPVVGTSGYAISASAIGQPDIGLVSSSEMLDRAKTIINAVSIPVDIDIDTGYGNATNVYWTIKNASQIGAAGVRLEDQDWPKRCGHMSGKTLISDEEMVGKIKAAILSRDTHNPDLAIGIRTDARSVSGFDETLKRAKKYACLGVDYIYVEAPQSIDEVRLLVDEVPVPLSFNIIPGGITPQFEVSELESIGVRYLSIPMICLFPAVKAMQESLQRFKCTRNINSITPLGVNWSECNNLLGMNFWRQIEETTLSELELKKKYG